MNKHKLFLLLSFLLLLVVKTFGQAAVDIPLIATDGTTTIPMAVGLDLTATNGIDPQLGESDLPPIPPTGIVEIRFDLQPYTGQPWSTYKDYRPPGNPPAFPFSGIIEHTLWWFNNSSSNMQLDITYNLPPGALMTITDQIGGSFLNLGPFAGQGTATIPGTYTAIFSKAFLIMECESIIPVELTSFTAIVLQNERAIKLNWTTATETNNSGFEILRKVYPTNSGTQYDNEWEAIGFVPGFGTTTEPKSYSFTDDYITTRTYKYRLKQIDFDGTFSYSNEIEVGVDFTPKEFVLYQNYPNPFNPSTTIKYTIPKVGTHRDASLQMVTLKVYDVLGNEVAVLVNQEQEPGVYKFEFDAYSLSSGTYFYQIKSGDFVDTKKMILLR